MSQDPQTDSRSAQEITSSAKSNLALALLCLPKSRRADLTIFYAFCRVIDDLADDDHLPRAKKEEGLRYWKDLLRDDYPDSAALTGLRREVVDLKTRHNIPTSLFHELIIGCEGDLSPQRFGTWEDLQGYTYRVACVVGLICLPLFGASAAAEDYAVKLGHALQLTNILRDVGDDLDHGTRIYLPLADLVRFQYTERDLIGRVHDGRFIALMDYETARARSLFTSAQEAFEALSKEDQAALKSPQTMGAIYSTLLSKIEKDRYQVFKKRYSLSKIKKALLLLKHGF